MFSRKRVLFERYYKRSGFSNLSIPQNLSKNILLGDVIGCKNRAKFLFRSVFLKRRANLVCFKNLWSCMCTTLVFECSPGPTLVFTYNYLHFLPHVFKCLSSQNARSVGLHCSMTFGGFTKARLFQIMVYNLYIGFQVGSDVNMHFM